jgi:hypothetical protein
MLNQQIGVPTMFHSDLVGMHLRTALNMGAFFPHYETHFDY